MKGAISAGKKKGLDAIAQARGVIAAVAIDQRHALRTLFSTAMKMDAAQVPTETLIQFKEAVSRILTPHASAILLDPEYGLPAASQRAKTAGLLLAYEQTGYDDHVPGRLPRLLEHWSVQRLKEQGANGIKLLLYYSTASETSINDQKHAFVERVGAECAAADIPFFLELVSYADGMDEKSRDFARAKPEMVIESMREFSDVRYQVDVLKVGVPVNLAFVEGAPSAKSEILYSRREAMLLYRRAAEATRLPFIYLSQGVSNQTFQFGLKLAIEAGAKFSGVLCGRATWKEGVAVLVDRGAHALDDWLAEEGVRNIQNVNSCLGSARPWFAVDPQPHPTESQECLSA
ncbi:MAG: tagatose 1,6-diphosphate aldolase [Candidatus Acidiferrum sp.]